MQVESPGGVAGEGHPGNPGVMEPFDRERFPARGEMGNVG